MALAGHGVAWLPRSLVAGEIASGALGVVGPEMPMEIRLYRSADRAQPFLDQVWAAAAALDDPDYAISDEPKSKIALATSSR